MQSWSKETGAVVVAGSHYSKTERGYIARSPVVVAGEVYFSEKLVPAPIELSPIAGEGLTPGECVRLFRGTPVGDLAVLICSDYLEQHLRQEILDRKPDFLCVPAFQRDSSAYHQRMSLDCDESPFGVYVLYANMRCEKHGDGRSALFAVMDSLYIDKLVAAGVSDAVPRCRSVN